LFDDGDKLDVAARYVYAEAECMDLDDNSDDDNAESDAGADVEIEQQSEHALYQKGFCMKWRDVYGLVRTSFGRIGELAPCPEGSADVGYTVEYKRSNDVVGVSGTEIHEVTQVVVTEKVAWGGYMAYMREIGAPTPKHNVPFYLTWRLPDTRRMDRHGRLELEIRGFRLLFQVQTSSIPCVQTAGIGLTVTATDLTGEDRPSLVLAPGELIGLGRYAPMTESDRKPKHVFEVKNFIHGNGPLSYVQDPNRHDGIVFDPTDDKTGSLNDAAVKNPLVRVNETDGMEVPSVMADFDPCGGVQFFLGHGEEAFGELRIPADEPLELKVGTLFCASANGGKPCL
jgi:hypothetical protein